MEVSSLPHAPATLPLGKEPSDPSDGEDKIDNAARNRIPVASQFNNWSTPAHPNTVHTNNRLYKHL
jgi:hypothetical protein